MRLIIAYVINMDNRHCKGSTVNAKLKYIKKKWGLLGMEEAMKFAGLSKAPKNGEWVPIRKEHLVMEWVVKNRGRKYIRDMGKHTSTNLGIFGLIFSFVSMEKLLERGRLNYKALFDFGDVVTENLGERKAKVTIKDYGTKDYMGDIWEGAIEGLMALAKVSGTVTRTDADGPADLAYILSWQ